MAKLMNDLQQAVSRAKLSGDQNDKVQSDIAALKDAQQARRQGQSVMVSPVNLFEPNLISPANSDRSSIRCRPFDSC
jgi:hypothetical protein